jgi:hypothetical protein
VLEALEKHGDDGAASRRIDHWAYFPTQQVAEQFRQWVQEHGYQSEESCPADDSNYQVQFAHEGTLRLSDITSHTIALRRKVSELGGDYDGWETPVCKTT